MLGDLTLYQIGHKPKVINDNQRAIVSKWGLKKIEEIFDKTDNLDAIFAAYLSRFIEIIHRLELVNKIEDETILLALLEKEFDKFKQNREV